MPSQTQTPAAIPTITGMRRRQSTLTYVGKEAWTSSPIPFILTKSYKELYKLMADINL